MSRASAPGKLVLLGEYAVLYGAPALVMAVERRAMVRIEDLSSGPDAAQILLTAAEIGARAVDLGPALASPSHRCPTEFRLVVETLRAAREDDLAATTALHLFIDSSAFYVDGEKIGLGSSAAVCTALLAALAMHRHGGLPAQDRLFTTALTAHRRFQNGRGSGIDIASSTYGGLLPFVQDRPRHTPMSNARVSSLGVDPIDAALLGHPAKTPVLVGAAQQAIATSAAAAQAKDRLVGLAEGLESCSTRAQLVQGISAYAAAYDEFGQACGVELFSAPHRLAAEIAHQHGGTYKPSGAGGGDLGFAFFARADPARQRSLYRQWTAAGLKPLPLNLAHQGVTAEK